MAKPRLTVCILAKNEEVNIRRALESVQAVADEIILVDTGSTDQTIAIAESYGSRVVHFPWNESFADGRNAGLAAATGDWVLMLDADEAISREMAEKLPKPLRDPEADAYMTIMSNYRDGAVLDRSAVLRLFRNRETYRYHGRVHESVAESINQHGGRIKTLRVAIEHYGYIPSEDSRKGRRERNKRLLEAMLAEDPNQASTWYFLGLEYMQAREFGAAALHLHKALTLNPKDLRSIYGAHLVTGINLYRQRLGETWDLALLGANHEVARWDSLMRLAETALFEGDFATSQEALQRLRRAPAGDFGKVDRGPAVLLDMEAMTLWQQGRRNEALQLWEQGVRSYPGEQRLAAQWVRYRVATDGLRTGALGALQSIKTSAVASGVAGALLRAGEYEIAATVSRNTLERGFLSPHTLYGMVCAGKVAEAEEVALSHGHDGALHMATASAWFDQPGSLQRSLAQLSGTWPRVFESALAGKPVPETELWALDILMEIWADAGALKLLDAAARSLSPEPGVGASRAAWLLYRAEQPRAALERALKHPDQPDSREVIGLISADQGDWQTGAQFLVERIMAGPAAVQVYYRAAQALVRMGRTAEAREVLQLGSSNRPHSRLLKAEAPHIRV